MKKLLFIIIILFCGIVHADTEPAVLEGPTTGCHKYRMCDVQMATGPCTKSGDEIVLPLGFRSQLTFYGTESVDAFVCNIESNTIGFDASSGDGHQINQNALTDGAPVLTLNGLFDQIWVDCSTVTTSVTIDVLVCTSNR